MVQLLGMGRRLLWARATGAWAASLSLLRWHPNGSSRALSQWNRYRRNWLWDRRDPEGTVAQWDSETVIGRWRTGLITELLLLLPLKTWMLGVLRLDEVLFDSGVYI